MRNAEFGIRALTSLIHNSSFRIPNYRRPVGMRSGLLLCKAAVGPHPCGAILSAGVLFNVQDLGAFLNNNLTAVLEVL